ncbi:MAG TPA: DUF3035 domain-containing protein [Acetobacteraceae bacterium]|nr:DUF3035 domain-containing protein [Acetobacteraceae bacterium]
MKFRSRTILPVLLTASTLALAGCGQSAEKTFGLEVTPPDAFDVGTEAPLSIPPEMAQLPRPEPGEPRPQQVPASQQAEEVLSPQSALAGNSATMGPGQQQLLAEAGPPPPAHIRSIVNSAANLESRSPGFVSSLMLWNRNKPAEQVVNAPAEQRRLEENAALGAPITQGNTPQESSAKPGFFQRLLNFF